MKRIVATILIVLVLFISVGCGHEETRVSPSASPAPSVITSPSSTPPAEPSHTPNISQYPENKEVLE